MVTNADEKTLSVSAPPTPKIDHNLNPDYDHPDHANLERSLYSTASPASTRQPRRSYILLSRSRSLTIATGH
jgi:hypothetical protein